MNRMFFQLIVIIVIVSFFSAPCFCHRINLFAYGQGDSIVGYAYFSNGRPAIGAEVILSCPGIEKRTITNNKGNFAFNVGVKKDCRVVLQAQDGHKAEVVIRAVDGKTVPKKKEVNGFVDGAGTSSLAMKNKLLVKEVDINEIEKRLDALLERHLAPIKSELRTLVIDRSRVTLNEIISGLGYIAGVFGLWAYLTAKKKS